MQTATHSIDPHRGDNVRFYLVYWATYPFFLSAEILKRWLAAASVDDEPQAPAQRSVFAASRESAFIAISYVLMARTTLRRFGRESRTERLS